MSRSVTTIPRRFCVRCGTPGPFRSSDAILCLECDEQKTEERREYHRLYHLARGRALRRLMEKHPSEFNRLFAEERGKIARQDSRERTG